MAESKRRGKDAVDEPVDDDLLADEVEDDNVDTDAAEAEDSADGAGRNGRSRRGRARAVAARDDTKAAAAKGDKVDKTDGKVRTEDGGPGLFGRFSRFIREIVAELRKVIWPTRKELITYTTVVVIFVALVLTIVAVLDWAFARGVLFVFGGKTK